MGLGVYGNMSNRTGRDEVVTKKRGHTFLELNYNKSNLLRHMIQFISVYQIYEFLQIMTLMTKNDINSSGCIP